MAESEYFQQQKQSSLNNLQNKADSWAVDVKYFSRAMNALERAKFDIEDGIVLKLQAQRQKELE